MSCQNGDEVICVDDAPRPDPVPLRRGATYTVAEVAVADDGAIGFGLVEVEPGEGFTHFFADRFRPVRDTDISALKRLLSPVDA